MIEAWKKFHLVTAPKTSNKKALHIEMNKHQVKNGLVELNDLILAQYQAANQVLKKKKKKPKRASKACKEFEAASSENSSPILPFKDSEFDQGPAVYADKVTLVAMDKRFEITTDTFSKVSRTTRVGKLRNFGQMSDSDLLKVCHSFDREKREFVFNRDALGLAVVLNLAITGHLHVRPRLCGFYLERELQYWLLDVKQMQVCCKASFCRERELLRGDEQLEERASSHVKDNLSCDPSWRSSIWEVVGARRPLSTKSSLVSLKQKESFILGEIFYSCWQLLYEILYQSPKNYRRI